MRENRHSIRVSIFLSITIGVFCHCLSPNQNMATVRTKQRLTEGRFSEFVLVWEDKFIERGIFSTSALQDEEFQSLSVRMRDALVRKLDANTRVTQLPTQPMNWMETLPSRIWNCAHTFEPDCDRIHIPPYITLKTSQKRGILYVGAKYTKDSIAATTMIWILLPFAGMSTVPSPINISRWTVRLHLLLLDQEGNVITSTATLREGILSGSWELFESQVDQLLKSSMLIDGKP